MIEDLAARLILAALQDDPCERDFRIRQIRAESGMDYCRFALALATAEEAASWWGGPSEGKHVARLLLEGKILERSGVGA